MSEVVSMDSGNHRRRLKNLADAYASIGKCLRHHYIGNYEFGQAFYNLGEYPENFSMAPKEYDYKKLEKMASEGVSIILFLEEWNDSQRLLGGDKFTAHDKAGFKDFINLCHSYGMKVLPYLSSGYFESRDPDYDPKWSHTACKMYGLYHRYQACCPASPEWRSYLLPRAKNILEEYGADGFWLDLGYPVWDRPEFMGRPMPCYDGREKERNGHISPSSESPEHDSALEDLLCIIYNMTHRSGGIIGMHYGYDVRVATSEKIYDYVMVGETIVELDQLREKIKNWQPYVITSCDMRVANVYDEKELYLHSIPYMQFPIRLDGRPMTGKRGMVPDVDYYKECPYIEYMHNIWDFYQKNPQGPYSYMLWDSYPPRAGRHETWAYYYHLYHPMVTSGSRAWLDIQDSSLFASMLPENVNASLFVNDRTYLVLANYGTKTRLISTCNQWRDRESSLCGRDWNLSGRSIRFLEDFNGAFGYDA